MPSLVRCLVMSGSESSFSCFADALLPWLLHSLKTLLPGLREQDKEGVLTLTIFYTLVVPFLDLAQFSPADQEYFATAPVREQQKGKRKRPVEFDEDAWRNDLDVHFFVRRKRQMLTRNTSAKEIKYMNVPQAGIAERVLISQPLRDLMKIRASLSTKAGITRKHEVQNHIEGSDAIGSDLPSANAHVKIFRRVSGPTPARSERTFDVDMIPQHQLKRKYTEPSDTSPSLGKRIRIMEESTYSSKLEEPFRLNEKAQNHRSRDVLRETAHVAAQQPLTVQDEFTSRDPEPIQPLVEIKSRVGTKLQQDKQEKMNLFRMMGEQKRQIILLRWSKTVAIPDDYRAPTSIKITFGHIVDQLLHSQLTKNWLQYSRLCDDWEPFCNFLDTATSQNLRSPSFREDCATWTERVFEPARYCYQNGMGLLGLSWSSVARFVGLLEFWLLENPDWTDDDLIKRIVDQLAPLQWYNFMPYMGSDSRPNQLGRRRLVHRLPLEPATICAAYRRSEEPAVEQLRQQEAYRDWLRTKELEMLEDSEYYPPDPRLSRLAPFTVSQIGHPKEYFVNQCLGAMRTLLCNTFQWIDNWIKSPTKKPGLYRRVLLPLCRGFYTLLKFQTPPQQFLGIANAYVVNNHLISCQKQKRDVQPLSDVLSILRRVKAAKWIKGAPGDAEVDGLAGEDLLDMVNYIIDVLVDAQAPGKQWPKAQLQTPPRGVWFTGISPTAVKTHTGMSSIVPEAESHGKNNGKEDNFCFDDTLILDINVSDNTNDSLKPTLVCKSWVASYKKLLPEESLTPGFAPQICLFEERLRNEHPPRPQHEIRRCRLLHPDMSRPGLCPKWLKNDCYDVDCILAHDDPVYPRNMQVAKMHPLKRLTICSHWQSDTCKHGARCMNAHFLPRGQSKSRCRFFASKTRCRNLDDRCEDLHSREAPFSDSPSLTYYSAEYDPVADASQPDRRPQHHAQRTHGGGVIMLCPNMLHTGTCWRGDKCWLEHDTSGVSESLTGPLAVPLTVPCVKLDCQNCTGPHRDLSLPLPDNSQHADVCEGYLKHGYCNYWPDKKTRSYWQDDRCSIYLRNQDMPLKTLAKRQVHSVAIEPDNTEHTNQPGSSIQNPAIGGANSFVNPNFILSPPEMIAAAMGQIPLNPWSSGATDVRSIGQQDYSTFDQFGHMRAYGTHQSPNPLMQQQAIPGNFDTRICNYCGIVGHIRRVCPQKRFDDQVRSPMASRAHGSSFAYGQYQHPNQQMQQLGHIIPPSTPLSSQFGPSMPPSTPVMGVSPFSHQSPTPNSSFASNRSYHRGHHNNGNQNMQQINNEQLRGANALASRSAFGQPHQQGQPSRRPLTELTGYDNSQQRNKRKHNGSVPSVSPEYKRHRSEKNSQEDRSSTAPTGHRPTNHESHRSRSRSEVLPCNITRKGRGFHTPGGPQASNIASLDSPKPGPVESRERTNFSAGISPTNDAAELEKRKKRARRFSKTATDINSRAS